MWSLAESEVAEPVNCCITVFWKKQLLFVFSTGLTGHGTVLPPEEKVLFSPCVWSEGNFHMRHHPGHASEQLSPIHPTVPCFAWRAVTNASSLESMEEQRQASHLQVPTQVLGTMSLLLHVTLRANHIDRKVRLCCFGQWCYVAPC